MTYLGDDTLMWASRFLIRGINPIPVKAKDKRPATAWKDLQDRPLVERHAAELDRYLLKWWPGHGVGIITGAASNLVVVDVDGADARELVTSTCGGWPVTTEVATARGAHLYFSHPGGRLANRAHVGDVALDVRADGGYVVAPPSIHPSGHAYRWVCWTDTPFPPMPAALRALLWPARVPAGSVRLGPARSGSYATKALAAEGEAVRAAPPGARNARLNKAAFALARFALAGELTGQVVADTLVAAALAAGLSEREARRTVASGFAGRLG